MQKKAVSFPRPPGDGRWFLGLGGSKHDYAACLLRDGRIEVAIEEERVTRQKRGYGVDIRKAECISYCLDHAGISLEEVAAVCVNDLLAVEMYEDIRLPVQVIGHHLTHAASAFFPSGFEEAAVLVADHSGGRFLDGDRLVAETLSYYHATDAGIELLGRIVGEDESGVTAAMGADLRGNRGVDLLKRPRNSIGRFYARISKKCGCVTRMGDGELHTESGKLMGLAAYGDDRYYRRLRPFIELAPGGEARVSMGMPGEGLEALCDEILQAAEAQGPDAHFQARAALAWAAQQILEEVILHCADYLQRATGSRNLCLAGGVCLNALANHRILERTAFENIFVQPAAHDAGTALGAALLGWWAEHGRNGSRRETAPFNPYLGRTYPKAEIEALLRREGVPFLVCERPSEAVAEAVARGLVVGLFQGRSEFGPRALGNRSILADCRNPEMKDILNKRIKFREIYRPYAPATRIEDVDRYFEMRSPSPYMTLIGHVRPEWRDRLPAITHVDDTARVQTVEPGINRSFYDILTAFAERTGVGVILNTSMNVMGEPIVETASDALRFLRNTNVDLLVLEDLLCARTEEDLDRLRDLAR